MAKIVLTDATVSVAGVDISNYVASITLTTSAAEVETTSFGSGGAVTRVGGLKDGSLALDIHQDYPVVDALLFPLLGSTAAFIVNPSGTTPGTATPDYSGTVLITELTPIAGAVGELATMSITLPISGTVARGTAT